MALLLPTHASIGEHIGYFSHFGREGAIPPSASGMREVNIRCHDATLIPVQLTITKAVIAGENVIVASLVDQRPIKLLQRVRRRVSSERALLSLPTRFSLRAGAQQVAEERERAVQLEVSRALEAQAGASRRQFISCVCSRRLQHAARQSSLLITARACMQLRVPRAAIAPALHHACRHRHQGGSGGRDRGGNVKRARRQRDVPPGALYARTHEFCLGRLIENPKRPGICARRAVDNLPLCRRG
jgi:hypothetical protein